MPDREVLRAQPEAMHAASQALANAAKDIQTKLVDLDGHLRETLAGWQGAAGGAYGDVWDQWHQGAGEVQLGLDMLARAIGAVSADFVAQEAASAQEVRDVYRG